MKMIDALQIMTLGERPRGYMVGFERVDGILLCSDYFPEKHLGEPLIPSEDEAWSMARDFAVKTVGRCVNIMVTDDRFSPVPGYKDRMIPNRHEKPDIDLDRSG